MKSDLEQGILRQAVRKKLITVGSLVQARLLKDLDPNLLSPQQEETLLFRSIDSGTITLDELLEKGLLDRDKVDSLIETLAELEVARQTLEPEAESKPAGEDINPSVQASEVHPQIFSRYHNLELIGTGGMAQVYKAYDPGLERTVALKFLTSVSPHLSERFLREARCQARLEHSNICKIYESGELDGQPYIAMQFIRGKTLNEYSGILSIDEKVKLMRQIAEAIHEAHRCGLIHRDIKPGNLMVEEKDGTLFPYVVDFGLAREIHTPGLTLTNLIIGTPLYMSPEQATGKAGNLDRRTDIYSLGVTLYEILSGSPPFEAGSNMALLQKIVEEDPLPLRKRNPTIPSDLETIVMKCLQKDPERRFDSAKALAEDLHRYLEGESILARPPSLIYQVSRKVRKHKALVGVSSIAILIAILLGGMTLSARWNAKQQAAAAQRFGAGINQIEAGLRYAYLLPLHDIRPERKRAQDRLRELEEQMNRIGEIAMGPGHYALGRGYLALHQYEEARKHLELAWDQYEYRVAPVSQSLGLTLTMLYQKELAKADRISEKEFREARHKKIEEELKQPALNYVQSGRTESETKEYMEALLAFLEKDYDKAIEKAEEASLRASWLYEAKRLQGDIATIRGNELRDRGDNDAAEAMYGKAEIAYAEAIQRGRSDSRNHEALCKLQYERMRVQVLGQNPKETFEKGIQACNAALTADPESSEGYSRKAALYFFWSEYQMMHGSDPETALQNALDLGHLALQHMAEEDPFAYNSLANAYTQKGESQLSRGLDGRPFFQEAIRYYKRAIEIDSNFLIAYNNLGLVCMNLGGYEVDHGKDPLPAWDDAIQAYEKAIRVKPDSFSFGSLGLVGLMKAEYEASSGLDPRSTIELATVHLQTALKLNPKYPMGWNNMGTAHMLLANYESMLGKDPRWSLNIAVQMYEKDSRLNPNVPFAFLGVAAAYEGKAEYDLETGLDPKESIVLAKSAIQKARDLKPQSAYMHDATINVLEARWNMNRGKSPNFLLQEAESSVKKAIAVRKRFDYFMKLAAIERWRVEWRNRQGLSGEPYFADGIAAADSCIELSPKASECYATKGVLLLIRSEREKDSSKAKESLAQAQKEIRSALEINKNLEHKYNMYLK